MVARPDRVQEGARAAERDPARGVAQLTALRVYADQVVISTLRRWDQRPEENRAIEWGLPSIGLSRVTRTGVRPPGIWHDALSPKGLLWTSKSSKSSGYTSGRSSRTAACRATANRARLDIQRGAMRCLRGDPDVSQAHDGSHQQRDRLPEFDHEHGTIAPRFSPYAASHA